MNVFDELRELERTGARSTRSCSILRRSPRTRLRSQGAGRLQGNQPARAQAPRARRIPVTCSCSYNISEAAFLDIVASAAIDTHAEIALVEKRTQGRDHPILITVPETYYLKCLILRKLA